MPGNFRQLNWHKGYIISAAKAEEPLSEKKTILNLSEKSNKNNP